MKRSQIFRIVIAGLSISNFLSTPSKAEGNLSDSIIAGVTLVSPSQISLGEPIIAEYSIENHTNQKIRMSLGTKGQDWCSFFMKDSSGNLISSGTSRYGVKSTGAYGVEDGFLSNSENCSGYIVITKYLSVPQADNYILTIHANIPCAVPKLTDEDMSTQDSVVSRDFTFPIVVAQMNSQSLTNRAEVLRDGVLKEQDKKLAQADLDALFSMPGVQAAPSWRALALQPGVVREPISEELMGLHSKTGIDILFQIMGGSGDKWIPSYANLRELYHNSDAELRTYIKIQAAVHGIDVKSIAGGPIMVD